MMIKQFIKGIYETFILAIGLVVGLIIVALDWLSKGKIDLFPLFSLPSVHEGEIGTWRDETKPSIFVSYASATQKYALEIGKHLQSEFQGKFIVYDQVFRYTHESWADQFREISFAWCIVAVCGANHWLSDAQHTELEFAMGRGIPIAFCRVMPFKRDEWFFDRKFWQKTWPHLVVEGFNLHGKKKAVKKEFLRLDNWIYECSRKPIDIPDVLMPNTIYKVCLEVRVNSLNGWSPADLIKIGEPKIVFNYGFLFKHWHGSRSSWEWPHHHQVVIPLKPMKKLGWYLAEISLPHRGFGHAVLTTAEPRDSYTDESGGISGPDNYMWWDFSVDTFI